MLIIPAIDIISGKCVRLTQGDYRRKTVYSSNPVSVAKKFASQGADMLHVVDLEGARDGTPKNLKTILEIRKRVMIPMQVGGGIRTIREARAYLANGIDRIVVSTAALSDRRFLKELVSVFSSHRITISLDFLGKRLKMNGWLKKAEVKLETFLEELKLLRIRHLIVTDIKSDGMLCEKSSFEFNQLLDLNWFSVCRAGGISDLKRLKVLQNCGAHAVIIGKALYEGRLNLADCQSALRPRSNLRKRIIPCLDVCDARVVKGVRFMNLKDSGDPVTLAKKYAAQGASELVFLDITASKEKRQTFSNMVKKIARNIFIPFTVGGGIRSISDIEILLNAGADKVSLNTAAIENPNLIKMAAKRFGSQCVVCAIDLKKVGHKYKVFSYAGNKETELEAIPWARKVAALGAGELLITSMDRDGTLHGYDLDFLKKISAMVKIPVIASGGAGKLEDLRDAFLKGKVDAVLAASIFHEGKYTISKVINYLKKYGIPID